ncbi:FliH/SctL family protein [Specibacter cremeus]|uniref:FliH/SctL family protein n=1 Tax=Specibacter cremeus TaxID=1629051 RepID=UPI000F7A66FD|nr:FliH/SctL family protein [Specibacter cremeus]
MSTEQTRSTGQTLSLAPSDRVLPAAFPVVAGTDHRRARERGHTEGRAAGYAAGLRHAETETEAARRHMEAEHAALLQRVRSDAATALARQLATLEAATRALERRTAPVLADAETVLADCALQLAQAVLGTVMDDAGTRARAALTRVLGHPGAAGPVRVRLHPDDLAVLERPLTDAADAGLANPAFAHLDLSSLDVVADDSLAPGDAVADFPDGFLDARIGTALERARAALLTDGSA